MREVRHEARQAVRKAGTRLREWEEGHLDPESGVRNGDAALAQGLGWLSVGLGLAEMAAPEGVARLIGVRDDDDNCALLRACGLRELANGVGLLTTDRPQSLLWGRVAGDVMDLLLLGTAAAAPETRRERLTLATAAVLGVTVLDVLGAGRHSKADRTWSRRAPARQLRTSPRSLVAETPRGVQVVKAITVKRTPEEVYRFWRQLDNLPRFMSHLESVEVRDGRHSHWKVKAPIGMSVEWDAELIEDRRGERLAWRSLAGAQVDNAGAVRFTPAPGGRGTEVHVELTYRPPAGKLGAVFAKLFGEAPEQQIAGDLRRFKQVLETGEVVHSDASVQRGPHHPPLPPGEGRGEGLPLPPGEGRGEGLPLPSGEGRGEGRAIGQPHTTKRSAP